MTEDRQASPQADRDEGWARCSSPARGAPALNDPENRWRALLRGMLDPVVVIDERGLIQEVSDSVGAVFGYARDEVLGRNVALLMPQPHRSRHDDYLESYRRTGSTWILNATRQLQVLHKDGHAIEIELSVARVDLPGVQGPLFCGTFRDVTRRKAAELAAAESQRRLRAVFDQEFQFVGLLAPDGTVLDTNDTALEIAGLERQDVIGRLFWEASWWAPRDRAPVQEGIRRAAQGEFVRFETCHRTRDGRELAIDFSLKPIRGPDGAVEFLLPEGRDITLIKDVQRRETTMLRALASIGESASILAHEIKNPITAVNIALRAVADRLGENDKEVLDDLVMRMKKLERTMRRTLEFARPVKLQLAPCPPHELFAAAVRSLAPECEGSGIEVEQEIGPGCRALQMDRGLTEDVLVNLLRNAMEAGARHVRLSAANGERGLVVLRVEDDGPGIPASQQASMFKPFVTNKPTGTGLGLAIVRKVIEEHGGEVECVESSLGGAAFVLRLPAASAGRADVRARAGV